NRHAQLDAERARAAGEHDAERRIRPPGRLYAPAVDRIFKVAHYRESGGGETHRQPIERGESTVRELAELLQIRRVLPAPAAIEKQREPIQDCPRGPGQEHEPE